VIANRSARAPEAGRRRNYAFLGVITDVSRERSVERRNTARPYCSTVRVKELTRYVVPLAVQLLWLVIWRENQQSSTGQPLLLGCMNALLTPALAVQLDSESLYNRMT
jgi:hypothetical protein